jgi:hypothetical protein
VHVIDSYTYAVSAHPVFACACVEGVRWGVRLFFGSFSYSQPDPSTSIETCAPDVSAIAQSATDDMGRQAGSPGNLFNRFRHVIQGCPNLVRAALCRLRARQFIDTDGFDVRASTRVLEVNSERHGALFRSIVHLGVKAGHMLNARLFILRWLHFPDGPGQVGKNADPKIVLVFPSLSFAQCAKLKDETLSARNALWNVIAVSGALGSPPAAGARLSMITSLMSQSWTTR